MAVFTHLSTVEIATFLAEHYPQIAPLHQAQGITQGVENTNYLLLCGNEASTERYILTLFEHRSQPEDIPYFMDVMAHFRAHGIDCPTPMANTLGTSVSRLKDKPAAVVSFLQGAECAQWQPAHMQSLGRVLACMHNAAQHFALQRDNALSLKGWQALRQRIGIRADDIAPDLSQLIDDELGFLQAHWPASLPRGVVHADMFPDNVFFEGTDVSGVIDFYFACDDAFAYDLAIVINAWCFASGKLQKDLCLALLDAYASLRPLNADEWKALPLLLRGAALRFLLTRVHDWVFHDAHAQVKPKDPHEYLAILHYHRAHSLTTLLREIQA